MAKKKEIKEEKGRISIQDLRSLVNKKAGVETAFDLNEENPSTVPGWISTGSHIIDCSIARGIKAGIPIGRITYLDALSGAGKSFACALITANAQKMGIRVVYFDSENATDPEFWKMAGVNVEEVLYIQALNIEYVFETIEELLTTDEQMLFILDSYAACPCKIEMEGGFNPQSTIALKPRVSGLGLKKLVLPLANKKATLVFTNHLFTNIPKPGDHSSRAEVMIEPLIAPGGTTIQFYPSLRLQLTGKKNKASFVLDELGHVIGTETKIKIKKSRFGTYNRELMVKLMWNTDNVRYSDEEGWLDILKASEVITTSTNGWSSFSLEDGTIKKFKISEFSKELENEEFKSLIMKSVEKILIDDFANKTGNASKYFDIESEE